MVKNKQVSAGNSDITESTNISLVEKFLLVLLGIQFIIAFIDLSSLGRPFFIILLKIIGLGILIGLITIILLKLPINRKVTISSSIGAIALLYSIAAVFLIIIGIISEYYILALPLITTPIFGLIYGTIGLKSNLKNLAKLGILLNVLTLLVIFVYLSLVSYSFYQFTNIMDIYTGY